MATDRIVDAVVIESRRGDFVISTDRGRLDVALVHGFLTNCYWAKCISRDVVERSIEHSLCFGVYDSSGALMQHPALQNLRRWSLVTRDAHGLYTQSGFTPLKAPERYMELHQADVYGTFRS